MSSERSWTCARSRGGRSRIAIAALGGQGGGVLADWIVEVAERYGWLVQLTSVPGVAQRTGTTVYYLETCPRARRRRRGTRVCADAGARRCGCGDRRRTHGGGARRGARLRERGSHHARGLVASRLRDHREIGDGRRYRRFGRGARGAQERVAAPGVLRHGCDRWRDRRASSARCCSARWPGSGVLPFPRELYEEAIRSGGVAVAASLGGFAQGFEQALKNAPVAGAIPPGAAPMSEAGRRLDAKIRGAYPAHLHGLIVEGVRRLMDYQDSAYADLYLTRLTEVLRLDDEAGGIAPQFRAHRERGALSRALDVVRGYDSRGRSQDPPQPFRALSRRGPRGARSKSSTSPNSCTRAFRSCARRCPRRSGGG